MGPREYFAAGSKNSEWGMHIWGTLAILAGQKSENSVSGVDKARESFSPARKRRSRSQRGKYYKRE